MKLFFQIFLLSLLSVSFVQAQDNDPSQDRKKSTSVTETPQVDPTLHRGTTRSAGGGGNEYALDVDDMGGFGTFRMQGSEFGSYLDFYIPDSTYYATLFSGNKGGSSSFTANASAEHDFYLGTYGAENFVQMLAGGAVRMHLASNGNVGIGTTDPDMKLHVNGGDIKIQDTSPGVFLYNEENALMGEMYVNSSDDLEIEGQTNGILFQTVDLNRMYIDNTGNVGIGTTSPDTRFHIIGNDNDGTTAGVTIQSGTQKMLIDGNEIDGLFDLNLNYNTNTKVTLGVGGGQVMVGTTSIPVGYKFGVDGKVICEEVWVKNSSAWPDYVFKADYDLTPLSELEAQIEQLGHLPNIPSEAAVAEGYQVGEMQKRLLRKIEELTLYAIDEHKKNNDLRNELTTAQTQIDELRQQVELLTKAITQSQNR